MASVGEVRNDLLAEQAALDDALAGLSSQDWAAQTASPGWSVADQIGHLAFFDDTAALAVTDSERFGAHASELFSSVTGDHSIDDATLGAYRALDAAGLVAAWRSNRIRLADASAGLGEDDRVVWYGPSMGSKSFLTARLMECWAHGVDALDAVGRSIEPTDRLAHIARLGFITRGWSYVNRKMDVPEVEVSVQLTAPSGAVWAYGNPDAAQSVSGPAVDFCRVVTQRSHVDDTDLTVVGASAREWMELAQAFAGAPTNGPTSQA